MQPKRIIGLSGGANAGKDTFFNILSLITPCKRFALADALKLDLQQRILDEHGFDILNCSVEQKNSVRPLLVEYGRQKRLQSAGTYWTSKLQKQIESHHGDEIIVITDIRYVVFPKDEFHWVKNVLGGELVFIQNYKDSGNKVYPPAVNKDEEENNAILRNLCDYYVEWPIIIRSLTDDKNTLIESLKPYVSKFNEWYQRRRANT